MKAKKNVKLIELSATTCAPCKTMKPILKKLTEKTGIEVEVIEIDTDEGLKKLDRLGFDNDISTVPTFFFCWKDEPLYTTVIDGTLALADLVALYEDVAEDVAMFEERGAK